MTSHRLLPRSILVLLLAVGLAACGGSDAADSDADAPAQEDGLTAAQLEHGIGPVEAISLEAIDPDLAEQGRAIFEMKCASCHKMDTRYVGPALGDVTERRSPAFVMNMMLNPAEMLQKHPEAKAMLAKFMTPMPNQSLSEDEARSILEYLRQIEANAASSPTTDS